MQNSGARGWREEGYGELLFNKYCLTELQFHKIKKVWGINGGYSCKTMYLLNCKLKNGPNVNFMLYMFYTIGLFHNLYHFLIHVPMSHISAFKNTFMVLNSQLVSLQVLCHLT